MDMNDVSPQPQYLDRPEWLLSPGYWLYHLETIAQGELEEPVLAYLAIPEENRAEFELRDARENEGGPEAYPCYRLPLPLPGGRMIAMEYHDLESAYEIGFCLYPGPEAEPIVLAGNFGQGWEPGIAWSDVTQVADAVRQTTGEETLAAAAVLLLFPAVLYGGDPQEVQALLRHALVTLGIADAGRAVPVAAWLFERGLGGESIRAPSEDPEPRSPYLGFLSG